MASGGSAEILITVPHATCPRPSNPLFRASEHLCDFAAPRAAQLLADALRQGSAAVEIFEGDVNRSRCDLNRRRCRLGTAYRRRVREQLERNTALRLLLDVHSYPPYGLDFSAHQMVLLDDRDDATSSHFARFLHTYLTTISGGEGGAVDVALLQGAIRVNDIQEEAHAYGLPALLLEFNEGLPEAEAQRLTQRVAHGTLEWLRVHHKRDAMQVLVS